MAKEPASLSKKKTPPKKHPATPTEPTPLDEDTAIIHTLLNKAYKAGRGALWLRHMMEERGFRAPLVQAATTLCSLNAYERAQDILIRKFGPLDQARKNTQEKMVRFLLARGFSPECVMKVLGQK